MVFKFNNISAISCRSALLEEETGVHRENHRPAVKRVWRYQRGNQNPYIEEEQTTQWLKDKSTGQTTIYKTYT